MNNNKINNNKKNIAFKINKIINIDKLDYYYNVINNNINYINSLNIVIKNNYTIHNILKLFNSIQFDYIECNYLINECSYKNISFINELINNYNYNDLQLIYTILKSFFI